MGRSGAQCGRGTPCRDRLERVAAGDCASHIEEGVPYLSVSFRQCNVAKDVVTFLALSFGQTFSLNCESLFDSCIVHTQLQFVRAWRYLVGWLKPERDIQRAKGESLPEGEVEGMHRVSLGI